MNNVQITGLGHYIPELRISNDDLARFIDTSDEWIHTRTGIRHRHIAAEDSAHSMAAKAATMALDKAGVLAEDIDMIVAATFTGDYAMPSMACLVQKDIGASNAMCFDLNAACSGFVYGLDVAEQFIRVGKHKKVLVIGSEKLSQILDWSDRGTCVLFGDGAGAAVLEAKTQSGILNTVNKAIGEDFECLYAKNPANKTPYYEGSDEHYLKMSGQEVFQFACSKVPESILELLDSSGVKAEDVDHFVLHQANARIITKIAKRMKIPVDKFYMNMDKYGNTSAASIPIALSELQDKLAGKKVVIAGFGGGLTYGSSLIQF